MDRALKQPNVWMSPPPEKCDIRGEPIIDVFIDGRNQINGKWGCMCPACFESYGYGLGTGLGQRYEKQGDLWVKTEG